MKSTLAFAALAVSGSAALIQKTGETKAKSTTPVASPSTFQGALESEMTWAHFKNDVKDHIKSANGKRSAREALVATYF
jgi:hypothetical protein